MHAKKLLSLHFCRDRSKTPAVPPCLTFHKGTPTSQTANTALPYNASTRLHILGKNLSPQTSRVHLSGPLTACIPPPQALFESVTGFISLSTVLQLNLKLVYLFSNPMSRKNSKFFSFVFLSTFCPFRILFRRNTICLFKGSGKIERILKADGKRNRLYGKVRIFKQHTCLLQPELN